MFLEDLLFIKWQSRDIDVFYNRFIVDAKSILGVFSLDLNKTLTVQYAGIDPHFEATLNKFCVA